MKRIPILAIALPLLGVAAVIAFLLASSKPASHKTKAVPNLPATLIDIDEVLRHPEAHAGRIAVEGSVSDVDQASSTFSLGCEDECAGMPVRFNGRLPGRGAGVIVIGEVRRLNREKYFFSADEVRVK